jgi:hypothetical protein
MVQAALPPAPLEAAQRIAEPDRRAEERVL